MLYFPRSMCYTVDLSKGEKDYKKRTKILLDKIKNVNFNPLFLIAEISNADM